MIFLMVRVRFAPSPTGFLHIGGLRTALYNFLYARKHSGTFILRIEDTDTARTVPGGADNIIRTLHTMGLDFDEGPVFQSTRLDIYQRYADELVASGNAYRCFCTTEELEAMREDQKRHGQQTRYDGRCRLTQGTRQGSHVVRLKAPLHGFTTVNDIIHGNLSFPNTTARPVASTDEQSISPYDVVLLKSGGYPTYHLASVVDDHDMNISHVIRGDEWLPSTPVHVLLYQAFGWKPPAFAHLPLLLNADRSKLSKRQMDVSVEDYLLKGYLPEALLNFVALLGWNPTADREVYTIHELIRSFDLARVNKSGSVINLEKLDWLNGEYIKKMPSDDLVRRARPFLERAGVDVAAVPPQTLQNMVALERERIRKLDELPDAILFMITAPTTYAADLLIWKKSDRTTARARLGALHVFLKTEFIGLWSSLALEEGIKAWMTRFGYGAGETLWPLRVALSGREASPGPFEIAAVIGKDETLIRLHHAIQKLS